MGISNAGLMGLLTSKMAYLNQRQSVLAENVANSNTPKFKAKDLTPFTFGDALNQANVGMNVTDPRHIIPASMAGVNGKTINMKSFETVPNGNSVDLEQQMMGVSQNAIEYNTVTSIYHHITNWFRIAVKGS